MYAIKLNSEDRLVEAVFTPLEIPGKVCISSLPPDPIDDYKYLNGKIIHDPRTDRPVFNPNAPTEMQILKGIVSALAMVTGHSEVLKNVKF